MAVVIPIISEFNGKGIKKAVQQFKQLEGAGAKAQFALKKAAAPATAALAGLGAAAVNFAKAAADDQLAANQLALALTNNTKATEAQIQANEDFISQTSMAAAVSDDELRPALQKLATGTGDLTKAQGLLQTALNISAATGIDLQTVSDALAKGYNGNTKALAKLSPQMKKLIKDGASFTDVTKKLDQQFAGASKTFADSAAGGFKQLDIAMNETKESIGAALLPVIQAALPVLKGFADWAQKNPGTFKVIAVAIAGVAASIMLINAAMALNPIGLIVIGIGALVAAVVLAYQKFEGFRKVVKVVFDAIKNYIKFMIGMWIKGINLVIKGLNLIPGVNIPEISNPFDKQMVFPVKGALGNETRGAFEVRTRPTNLSAPSVGANAMGVGASSITVQVNGADPNAVVQTLRKYVRQTGSLPVRTANIG